MSNTDERARSNYLFDLQPDLDDYDASYTVDSPNVPSNEIDIENVIPIQSVPASDREAFIRLALVNGVGPKLIAALIARFGSASQTLKATLSQLGEVTRIGPKLATSIRENGHADLYQKVLDHCGNHGVEIVLIGDPVYPRLLSEIADPPVLLFTKGEFAPTDQLSVAMVGTRHCTHYGKTMAERIAQSLARYGITVVSGLARGIDGICHRSALESGGRTIAVLGGSVTDVYPPEHLELANTITKHGVLISETHPFAKPKAGVFPQRNRIISGLCLGVIVIEAAEKSGSLITARHAGDQGRDLFAVPGPATSRMSRGCNALIRDGAILIQDAEDVIEHLGPLVERAELGSGKIVHHPAELQLNEIENAVLQAIESSPTDIDQIIIRSQLPVPRVLSTISVLEMRGLIVRSSGRTVARR